MRGLAWAGLAREEVAEAGLGRVVLGAIPYKYKHPLLSERLGTLHKGTHPAHQPRSRENRVQGGLRIHAGSAGGREHGVRGGFGTRAGLAHGGSRKGLVT